MQTYDIRIPVGGVQEINVPGNYVYFLDGSAGGADNTITVRSGNGGDTFLLRPGQAVRLGGSDINRWIIGNSKGQATIVGTLLLGAGEFSDNRISGSVEVIDGGKNRTNAGAAFMSYASQSSASPNYAHVQLWNPAASAKRLIISQIIVSSNNAGNIVLHSDTVALAAVRNTGFSKLAGGAAGVGEVRNESRATRSANGYAAINVAANVTQTLRLSEPIVVEPGYGLSALHDVNGTSVFMLAAFEWYEESK